MATIAKQINSHDLSEPKMHKKKFNVVIRDLFGIALCVDDDGSEMLEYSNCMEPTEYKNIFKCDSGGMTWYYTDDMILVYDSIEDCINKINGWNEWDLELNTA